MSYLYHLFIYDPILNTLVFLYQTVAGGDLGLAIILLTILVRIILFPVFQKSTKYQLVMQQLQPKLKAIREEHKKNFEKRAEHEMALYKEYRVNPFSGIFLLLIQLPLLIALYHILSNIIKPDAFQYLYGFLETPTTLNTSFLGLINLEKPNTILVGIMAVVQYFQMRTALPPKQEKQGQTVQERVSQQMMYVVPVILFFVFISLPAAITLYWIVMSLFSIVQQIYLQKHTSHGTVGTPSP